MLISRHAPCNKLLFLVQKFHFRWNPTIHFRDFIEIPTKRLNQNCFSTREGRSAETEFGWVSLDKFQKKPCAAAICKFDLASLGNCLSLTSHLLAIHNKMNPYYVQGKVLELFCEKCQNAVCIMCVFQTGQEGTSTCHS